MRQREKGRKSEEEKARDSGGSVNLVSLEETCYQSMLGCGVGAGEKQAIKECGGQLKERGTGIRTLCIITNI